MDKFEPQLSEVVQIWTKIDDQIGAKLGTKVVVKFVGLGLLQTA